MRISPARVIASLLIPGWLTLAEPAWPAGGQEEASSPVPAGPLDGLTFDGRYGPKEKPRDRPDTLRFEGGWFWSEDCSRHGFGPAPYWVRFEGANIRFSAVLESADNGTLAFEGVVRGPEMAATVTWRKKRWYWSIDQQFAYEGSLSEHTPLALMRNKFQARRPVTALPNVSAAPQ